MNIINKLILISFLSLLFLIVISWNENDEEILNDEVTSVLELLCSAVDNDFNSYCERILVTYKISKLVSLSYDSVVKEDSLAVVKLLLNQNLKSKYSLTKDFMKYSYLSYEKIAHFLSDMILSIFESGSEYYITICSNKKFL